MTNGNDLAFTDGYPSRGRLTKRELFAAMAMQGILANRGYFEVVAPNCSPDELAVSYAKDLITELNKEVRS